jgi:hypothetical protein
MTEYELVNMNNELVNTGIMMLTAYFSTVTGFLVAAYVAAHRLTKSMVATIVGLFLWSCFTLTMTMYRLIVDFIGLRNQIYEYARTGKGLSWHSASFYPIPDYATYIVPSTWTIVAIAAVYFFFHCRRVNRKVELEAATD